MPVSTAHASSSRRRTNGHTAPPPIEDDSADEAPVRNKGKGKAAPNGATRTNGADRSGEVLAEEGWTIDTFQSRPITKSGNVIATLRSLQDRLREMQTQIGDGLEKGKELAKMIEDVEEDDELIETIDAGFRKSLEEKQLLQIQFDLLAELSQRIQRGEEVVDPLGWFQGERERRTAAFMSQSQRAKFKLSEDYTEFRTAIWAINHPDEGCPPVTRWLPKSSDDSDDSDFEIGGATQHYRCPITLQTYVDAHTNPACGHSYSGQAIFALLDQQKQNSGRRSMGCPNPGCSAKVDKVDLKRNDKLQKQADEYERRRKRREAEENDVDHVDVSQDD